jgi:AcrR family transcriptional regulator
LFSYFLNKDEILLSLLFEGIDFTAAMLDEIIAAELPPRERLARTWKSYGKLNSEHPEYIHLFGYLARPRATLNISAEVKSEIAKRSGDNFRRLAAILEGVVAAGNERVAADLVWGAFIGIKTLKETRQNLGAPAHPTEKELALVFDVLVMGLTGTGKKGGA